MGQICNYIAFGPDGAPSSSPLNSIRRGGPNASRANDQIPAPPGIDVDGIAEPRPTIS
jgi:hypothetical protein